MTEHAGSYDFDSRPGYFIAKLLENGTKNKSE